MRRQTRGERSGDRPRSRDPGVFSPSVMGFRLDRAEIRRGFIANRGVGATGSARSSRKQRLDVGPWFLRPTPKPPCFSLSIWPVRDGSMPDGEKICCKQGSLRGRLGWIHPEPSLSAGCPCSSTQLYCLARGERDGGGEGAKKGDSAVVLLGLGEIWKACHRPRRELQPGGNRI